MCRCINKTVTYATKQKSSTKHVKQVRESDNLKHNRKNNKKTTKQTN